MDLLKAFAAKAQAARTARERKRAPAAPLAPHAPMLAADPYSFAVSHRRMAWLLRLIAGYSIAVTILCVVLGNAIATMLPLKTTEIGLIRINSNDDRVFRVEPLTRGTDGFDLVMESAAKQYVRDLLEIDPITQELRRRAVARMTDATYWKKYVREHKDEVEDGLKSGLVRSITVESANRLEISGRVYKYAVDFTQTDKRNGAVVETKKGRAYLNLTTRPHEVHPADKYENALGVTVIDLVLKERANS